MTNIPDSLMSVNGCTYDRLSKKLYNSFNSSPHCINKDNVIEIYSYNDKVYYMIFI